MYRFRLNYKEMCEEELRKHNLIEKGILKDCKKKAYCRKKNYLREHILKKIQENAEIFMKEVKKNKHG